MARKRDREVTPETDQSSGDDEAAEEEELTSEPALLKLTKENLLALARKLKVSKVETLRTKAAIIAAILAAKQLETNAGRDTQGNPDLKLWLELLEPYTGKLDCPRRLSWANPRICLCPPLWCAIFWCQPPSEVEIFGPLGGQGVLVRNMKDRWKDLTGDAEAPADLGNHFTNMYTSITAAHLRVAATIDSESVIETWLERSWKMQVNAPLTLCRMMQAKQARDMGLNEIATKVEARALLPLEGFSADLAPMIKKAMEKSSDRAGGAGSHPHPQNPAGNTRTFKCFKCKKKIAMKPGVARRDAVAEHRKSCK